MGEMRDAEHDARLAEAEPDEYLRRREFLQRAALTAGLGAGLATVLDAETLVAEAARRQRRRRLPSPRNMPVDTFVVLMMENRSFDHYLGWMPEADGRQAGLSYVDATGRRLATKRLAPDWQGCGHPDPDHSWNGGRAQVNGGRMDGFLKGRNDVFAISYYKDGDLGFIQEAAKRSTAYDRFFCSVLGPTYPNREYMHAAQSYGQKGNYIPTEEQGFPDTTIWAQCDRAGVSNRYFFSDIPVTGLWGRPALARSSRVDEYYARCATGTLPHVSFVDPPFGPQVGAGDVRADEHPHGDVRAGQAFMADVVHAFMESPQWRTGALFIVYDEWGGFFDHVRPPRVPDDRNDRDVREDFGQLGIRIPAVALSPYARREHVSHSIFGFESILKMIEYRFGLPPLTRRDRYAQNIARSFDWERRPRIVPPALPTPVDVVSQPCSTAAHAGGQSGGEPHDLMRMVTSGYLDRLGFDYRPASASTTFREPDSVSSAMR